MRFRASRGERALQLVVAAVWCASAVPAFLSGWWSLAVIAILCTVFWLAGFALNTWRYGVTFTTDAVVIQGVRRRTIPPAAVSNVSTRERWGASHIIVTGPKRPILRSAPMTGPITFDAAFDAKARAVKEWAASGRLETF